MGDFEIEAAIKAIVTVLGGALVGGIVLALVLRRKRLAWTWAAPGLLVAYLLARPDTTDGLAVAGASFLALALGAAWHWQDAHYGVDYAQDAAERITIRGALARSAHRRGRKRYGWIRDGWLEVGQDARGLPVGIHVSTTSGAHSLVLGATGSGKTVSETWIASRLIEHGHGAIVIDPKGDKLLHEHTRRAAAESGRAFLEWTPEGPCSYNPYASGGTSEIADKALAGETYTEPHYLRQAQRYLAHAVRTLHSAQIPITPATLAAQLDPRQLDVAARNLNAENAAAVVHEYLDSLTDRQRRELAGLRDRLSILAESDINVWLQPHDVAPEINLRAAVDEQAVVYFRLDADRRPLLSHMLATAILSDLVTLVAELQTRPTPTVLVLDEFAAIDAEQVSRLFARSRSAGVSLILGAQELADLAHVDAALQDRVLGNVQTIIAHRQNVPASAELIANVAGTQAAWITTHQTEGRLLGHSHSGRGTRRRGYEFRIHPAQLKQLPTGNAAVITPGIGAQPTIAQIHHPEDAQR